MYEFPKTFTLLKQDYGDLEFYDKDLESCMEHYDFILKIDGGWMFFENAEDFHAEEVKQVNAQMIRDYQEHLKKS